MSTANQIRLDYPDDEEVRLRVSRFLCSRHFPAFRELDIDVEQGAVTLTGEVRSFYEKQIAMKSSQNVDGVLSIVDEIIVSPVGVLEEVSSF